MTRIELTSNPTIRQLLVSRGLQTGIRGVTLVGFLFAILAGLLGTRVGSHNFAIIFVWIAWWTGLKLFFIPLGRPVLVRDLPDPDARGMAPARRPARPGREGPRPGFGRRWPAFLRNSWLQVGFFVLMGLFSAVILTQPQVTGWVLLGLIALAIGLSLVFERRAFCRYLCPIGGFTGLYAQMAPLEVRVKDPALCAAHTEKTCYTGSSEGFGCPWDVFPAALQENTHCGLCMECLRTCTYDNIALNLRQPGIELAQPARARLDEAVLGLVMLGSGLIYSAVFLGPWGPLKAAAYQIGSLPWLVYALAFLATVLGLVPGLFFAAAGLGKKLAGIPAPLRKVAAQMSQALQPLGLSAWVAFTLAFAFCQALVRPPGPLRSLRLGLEPIRDQPSVRGARPGRGHTLSAGPRHRCRPGFFRPDRPPGRREAGSNGSGFCPAGPSGDPVLPGLFGRAAGPAARMRSERTRPPVFIPVHRRPGARDRGSLPGICQVLLRRPGRGDRAACQPARIGRLDAR